jgi:uncharacterized membrane protein YbhN (UPF0104 family)
LPRPDVKSLLTALEWFRGSPRGRTVSHALVFGLLVFLALRLWRLWSSADFSLRDAQPAIAGAAVLVSTLAVASYGYVWLVTLRRLGVPAGREQLGVFLKSQLGKYIPGSIWQYAGRVELGRDAGIPANIGLASISVEVGASVAAALLLGLLAMPRLVAVGVLACVLFFALVAAGTRSPISRIVNGVARIDKAFLGSAIRLVPLVIPLYCAVWLVYGLAFWLTARSLYAVSASDVLLYVGVFALAWAVGFVAIFAPGGVGVREAMIVALLSSHLGGARVIVLAGSSRLLLTTIDLVLGALSFGGIWRVPRGRRVETDR